MDNSVMFKNVMAAINKASKEREELKKLIQRKESMLQEHDKLWTAVMKNQKVEEIENDRKRISDIPYETAEEIKKLMGGYADDLRGEAVMKASQYDPAGMAILSSGLASAADLMALNREYEEAGNTTMLRFVSDYVAKNNLVGATGIHYVSPVEKAERQQNDLAYISRVIVSNSGDHEVYNRLEDSVRDVLGVCRDAEGQAEQEEA